VSGSQLKAGDIVTLQITPKDQFGNVLVMTQDLLTAANFAY